MPSSARTHWDQLYARSAVPELSWYQHDPDRSLALIAATGAGPQDPIVDVGGGASVLVDRLLDAGYGDLTVLDVAAAALDRARTRLGSRAGRVTWLVADLLTWVPARRYRVWHDRAVFHFLTAAAARDRYREVLHHALVPGGHVAVGTFAADGPTSCSGLPTARYGPDELAAQFPGYRVVHRRREVHRTPSGGIQPFTWLLLRAGAAENDRAARA